MKNFGDLERVIKPRKVEAIYTVILGLAVLLITVVASDVLDHYVWMLVIPVKWVLVVAGAVLLITGVTMLHSKITTEDRIELYTNGVVCGDFSVPYRELTMSKRTGKDAAIILRSSEETTTFGHSISGRNFDILEEKIAENQAMRGSE